MRVIVTVKAMPETQAEQINTLASQFEQCRAHFEALKAEGLFGPPELAETRYMIQCCSFPPEIREPDTEQAD